MAYVIGVDVGGTFTDAVLDDDAGTVLAAKSPSTPPDYSRGVLDVLELLAEQLGRPLPEMLADTHHIAHGTTSSLNALVTGNVPAVGFLTTKGHRDSIFIMNVEGRYLGRSPHELQHVLGQSKQHGLLPKRHALEVTERIDRDGNVVVALDEDAAREAHPRAPGRRGARDRGVAAVVVPQPGARAAAARADRRGRPRRVRRAVVRGQPADPGVRPQRHHDHEHPDRPRPARLPLLTGGRAARTRAGRSAARDAVQRRRRGRARGARLRDQHGRVGAHRRCRRIRRAGSPARPPQHHLHRRRRHHVPRRARRRRRAGARHHHGDQPPPDQRADVARRGHRLRRRRHRLARPGRQPAHRPAQRAGRARARLLRGRRHRADQHRRQPGARHPPRAGPARRAQAAVGRARPPGHRHPDRQAARPLRRGGRGGDLRRAERADRRPAAQDRRRGGPRPRDFVLYAFGGAGPAHCARYAAEVGATEVVVPLGPVASAFSAFGLASSDIVLAAELSDPTFVPFDPARAERNFADLGAAGARRARPTGPAVRDRRAAPRDRHALLDAARRGHRAGGGRRRSTRPRSRPPRRRSSSATPSCTARTPGFREAGIQAITFRVRGVGVLPFSPELPAVPAADAADPAAAQTGTRPVCLDAPRRLRRHRRSTTTAPCARATSSPGPRSSRCRPPPSSCPAGTHRHGRPPRQPHHPERHR